MGWFTAHWHPKFVSSVILELRCPIWQSSLTYYECGTLNVASEIEKLNFYVILFKF